MSTVRNARFWIISSDGDPVMLTLAPGESLTRQSGGPTEEGYHYETETFEHTGDGVRLTWNTVGRDCDGRIDAEGESFCPLDQLAARIVESEPEWPALPQWQHVARSQRDYTAEAAGY